MIDVIIPLYNARDTLARTLYSILLQKNVHEIKVTLVDDASSCSYDDIIDQFSKQLNLQYFRLEKNSGPGVARQYGLDHTSAPFFVFCDSDDVFYDCYSLRNLKDFLIDGGYDAVSGKVIEMSEKIFDCFVARFDMLHGKMYSRSYLESHSIEFPPFYHSEDVGFNELWTANLARLGFCDSNIVTVYVRREGSLTTDDTYQDIHVSSYLESQKWVVSYGEKHNVPPEGIANVIYQAFVYMYSYFYGNLDDPDLKYLISMLPIFDQYYPFVQEESKIETCSFWFNGMGHYSYLFTFREFLDYCRKRAGEENG